MVERRPPTTSKFADKYKLEKNLVYLIRGNSDGSPAWYYLKLKDKIKLALLQNKSKNKEENVPLEEFGEIIKSGWGQDPPEEVVKEMEEKFS